MRRTTLVGISVTALLAAGCSSDTSAPAAADAAPRPDPATSAWDTIPDVVTDVAPSVVAIGTEGGEGSGVIWDADGIVVTNAHVVRDVEEATVTFADGTTTDAEVVATDEVVDLAVLRTDREDLPAVRVEPELPEVGSLAIAVGNPLGFENTVSAGIVSALHRSIPGSAQTTPALVDLIQTDAAISPGNSGGALLDGSGQLIGINVAYIPPQARAVSIGFAIPAATVSETVADLLEDGTAEHPWIGITPAPLTPRLAREFELGARSGVLVAQIQNDGPADQAGFRVGDLIVELEGTAVASVEDILSTIRALEPGDELRVELVRDGERMEVSVTLGQRPRTPGQ